MTAREAGPQRLRLIMAALVSAVLLSSLDGMMFNTALPTIVGQLRGIALMSWVPAAYLLATALTMPVYGKLGDLFGRKWLFVAALALFLSGSVVGGLAGSMPVLITARAVQGLGSGGLMVLSQAIIADVVPSRERGRYMAVVGSVFIFSSVAGPLLGGWFTTTIGWRWAFWVNVPVAVLAITAAVALLQAGPPAARRRLAALGVSPIPLRLFTSREFVLATIGGMCGAVAMFGTVGYLPTYLQMVDGLSPAVAGLFMVPMVAGIGTTSFASGHLMSRTGRYAWMPVAGAATVAAALGLLALLRVSTPPWAVGADAYLFGAGMGFGMQTLTIVAQNAFPDEVGTATAAFAFFREIGATLGAAVVGGLFTARLTALLAARLPARLADAHALTPALVATFPAVLRAHVVSAYHDALTPVYLGLAPLMLAAAALLLFVREHPAGPTSPAGTMPARAAGDLAAHGSES